MPINLYFDTVFAFSGDRTAVPDATQPSGSVSYTQGYPISYQTPVASGGLDFPRTPHNQILYDITSAIQNIQQNGAPFFITTAMNGGVDPFSYILGAIVSYDAGSGLQVWVSTAAANTTIPGAGGAHWEPLTSPASNLFVGATTTGSANAQSTVTTAGSFTNTAGNIVVAKAGISNQGTSTITVDSVSNIPIKVPCGSGLRDTVLGDIILNQMLVLVSDGTNLQLLGTASGRKQLSATTNYYVATTGSDSTGSGTSGSPWATLQHAYNYIAANIDIAGQACNVNMADGSYGAGVQASVPTVGGFINFIGNTGTPTNCNIASTSGDCFSAGGAGVQFSISGFSMSTSGSGRNCVTTGQNATINIVGNCNFGAVVSSGYHISIAGGGQLVIASNYSISGGGLAHYNVEQGEIFLNSLTVSITGTPTFTSAFAQTSSLGSINAQNITYSGSVTGQRYLIGANGVINTAGGGANYFPGTIAGSSGSNGGQYV